MPAMESITAGLVFWGIFISGVGFAFFSYGKKRSDALALIAGLMLMIYPYFIYSLGWSVVLGVGICAVYFFLKFFVGI